MKLTQPVAHCLFRLTQPEFAPLLDYLNALREEARDSLESAGSDDNRLRNLQGEAKAYKRLLSEIAQSRDTLTKMNS